MVDDDVPDTITLTNITQITNRDHGSLSGLTDDDHSIYALLAGRAGGQTIVGGTGTTDDLVLRTTAGTGASGADMIFQTGDNGGTEAMRILYDGKVGIGTAAPGAKLNVVSTAPSNENILRIAGAGGTNNPAVSLFADESSNVVGLRLGGTIAPDSIRFRNNTGTIDLMTIKNDGNVGVGTTNPGAKLQISFAETNTNPAAATGGIVLQNTNTTLQAVNGLMFANAGGYYTSGIAGLSKTDASTNSDGELSFMTKLSGNFYERARIDNSGNVGIGTASPGALLHLDKTFTDTGLSELARFVHRRTDVGDTDEGSYLSFKVADANNSGDTFDHARISWRNNGTGSDENEGELGFWTANNGTIAQNLTISSAGNVGIGTVAPGYPLEVYSTTNSMLKAGGGTNTKIISEASGSPSFTLVDTGETDPAGRFYIRSSDDNMYFGRYASASFGSYGDKITLQSGGNVGIGTASPGNKLTVLPADNGGITVREYDNGNDAVKLSASGASGWLSLYGNGTETVHLHGYNGENNYINSGNVGIGTVVPQKSLSVHSGGSGTGNNNPVALFGNMTGYLADGDWTGLALSRSSSARETAGVLLERSGDYQKLHLALSSISGGDDDISDTDAKLTIDYNGNVGIGTTSPGTALQLGDGTATGKYIMEKGPVSELYFGENTGVSHMGQNNSAKIMQVAAYPLAIGTFSAQPLIFGTNNTEQMRILSSGNVGIGTTNPLAKLEVYAGANAYTRFAGSGVAIQSENGSTPIFSVTGSSTADLVNIIDGSSEVFTILDGGNVGIGTASPLEKLHVVGNIRNSALAGTGNRAVYSDANGNLTNSSSDIRLKTNIENLSDNLDVLGTLGRLRGIYYNWDASNSAVQGLGTQREIGMAAQEVQAVLPELVGQNASGYLSLDYPKMTAYLVEVAKAQQDQIEELKYTLNGFGLLNSTSTVDMAIFHAGGLGAAIQAALQSLGMALRDGVATLKEVVAEKITAKQADIEQIQNKQIQTEQINTRQVCVSGNDGESVCLTKDQLKDLIKKAGSSVTINQVYQASPEISDSTTTAAVIN